jgi:hypothetical protein
MISPRARHGIRSTGDTAPARGASSSDRQVKASQVIDALRLMLSPIAWAR